MFGPLNVRAITRNNIEQNTEVDPGGPVVIILGYHTHVKIRGSRVRSRPGSMDFFQSVKILSMTSFGREVKPWVPYRRFMARKRTSSRN